MEKDIDIIIWDLETTGFVAPACRILEVGAIIITGETIEKKQWVFQNNCEIPEKITELTGITKEIIDAEGRDQKECLAEFLPLFKRTKKNITHNGIKFDIPFLVAYSADVMAYTPDQAKAIIALLYETAFDTAVHFKAKKLSMLQTGEETFLQFATRVMNVRALGVKYSLGLCAEESKIDMTDVVAHRAMADVETTYKLFQTISAVHVSA